MGALGLVVFAAGLALPRWLSALRGPHQHRSPGELGLDLGFVGLLAHHLGDGLALGAYSRGGSAHGHAHTDVLLALVLHTVPLVAVVAAGYARARGVRVAVTRSLALSLASVVGVLCSHLVPSAIVDSATAWIAAGVSGLLLHGLAHDLGRDLPRAPLGRSMDLAMALLGIAVGVYGARLGEHAGGHVGDAGQAKHFHAHLARHDRFGHRRHADGIGAENPERADLGRRLVAWPVDGDVDAVLERQADIAAGLVGQRAQAPRVHLGHVRKARAEAIVLRPDERIAAEQIDVIVDHHQRAGRQLNVDPAGGVGEDQLLHAEAPHHPHRERHRTEIVPFVGVHTPRERRDALAGDGADDQPPRVADHRGARRAEQGRITGA